MEYTIVKNENEHYMSLAIKQAKKAAANEDVPIGCVDRKSVV